MNNFLILITHNLSKIIPTIRSRCLIIKVPEFSLTQFFEILSQNKINNSENNVKIGIIKPYIISGVCVDKFVIRLDVFFFKKKTMDY
mgnify:CR=1 FL=1